MYFKRLNLKCNGNRRDKVASTTTCINNVKFKIIKITTCQKKGSFIYYSENLPWTARKTRLSPMGPAGPGLDIAGIEKDKGENDNGEDVLFSAVLELEIYLQPNDIESTWSRTTVHNPRPYGRMRPSIMKFAAVYM